MKLYTEEQVRVAMSMSFVIGYDIDIKQVIKSLESIELPSDEEIKEKVELILSYDKNREEEEAVSAGFALGAKWVIEQIKQQDNGMEINN